MNMAQAKETIWREFNSERLLYQIIWVDWVNYNILGPAKTL